MGAAGAKVWWAVGRQALGPAAGKRMVSGGSGGQLACVPPGKPCAGLLPSWSGAGEAGSNNWALAGSRTASGLPLLAGDPHRPLEGPNVYVHGHICCPPWDVLGLAFPGVPAFSHFAPTASGPRAITHA